jgi:hypothetical protein
MLFHAILAKRLCPRISMFNQALRTLAYVMLSVYFDGFVSLRWFLYPDDTWPNANDS